MVDLSNIDIGKTTAPDIAAAAAGTEKVKEAKDKEKKVAADKGLGLEDIPKTPKTVDVEHVDDTTATEDTAESVLDKIDHELDDLQKEIKDVIARKIKLADKHDDKKHELLISAFNDCKNAYLKIKEVRDALG